MLRLSDFGEVNLNYNSSFNFLFILGLFALSCIPISGQTGKWEVGSGTVKIFNISPEEARTKAIDIARADAIQKATGVIISEGILSYQSETSSDNNYDYFSSFSKFANQNFSGKITNEKIISDKIETTNGTLSYKVELEAFVENEVGAPDPNFNVDIVMEKQVYLFRGSANSSDALEFSIWASQDCFIYLFVLSATDSVQMLIPNKYMYNIRYIAGSTEQEFERDARKIDLKFTVSLPPDISRAYEALYVVALKDKIDPLLDGVSSLFKNQATGAVLALTELNKWLVRIPADRRTQNITKYEIRKIGS